MKFVVDRSSEDRWTWRLQSEDGEPVAQSAEVFKTRTLALQSIYALRARAKLAPVFDPLGNLMTEGQN